MPPAAFAAASKLACTWATSLPYTAVQAPATAVTVDTSTSRIFSTSGSANWLDTSSGVSTSFSASAASTASPFALQPASPRLSFCAAMRAPSSDCIRSPHALDGKPVTPTRGLPFAFRSHSSQSSAHLSAGQASKPFRQAGTSRLARSSALQSPDDPVKSGAYRKAPMSSPQKKSCGDDSTDDRCRRCLCPMTLCIRARSMPAPPGAATDSNTLVTSAPASLSPSCSTSASFRLTLMR
mmetsp:Transcript_85185/g.228453  ORF Transcript_85185/g.228453 Transcript_85185/m.228453 type:complete len:238 (+) Transcript_85185:1799-2512(+)